MKHCKILFIISFLFSLTTVQIYAQHSILGPSESCYADCKIYNLSGGVGGPYYWKTTGEIQGTNQGSTIEICWNTIGSNTITLVDFSAPIVDQIQKNRCFRCRYSNTKYNSSQISRMYHKRYAYFSKRRG